MKSTSGDRLPVAIFASGNGTNFEAIAKAQLPIEIKLLVCDHHDAYVLKRAAQFGVPALVIEAKHGTTKQHREQIILNHLRVEGVKAIFLAGYMRIIGPTLLDAFPKRIINIHPALLPNFPGLHGIEDAYAANVSQTGVTIHYIDSGVDTGQIIAQQSVPRYPDDHVDDLATRIHAVEHQLYPNTILDLIKKGVL
ncbi:phosphoribosylglycinamide formyltransferase [Nicoliella spurrieriana]|uniref:Phosphoribosylglycinamide formyltransferase n=1 Tax=Nicoliella spurrieriana TaxID=2925830 RepID=A0A976X580_9LACO|nr:phosphoribosylglycinamide formyltransferase [Nicoliella spurrieriana]UQS86743.1 phosphoribosylglycinamide formyltransferase [Nicoliella spurrieriana]